MGNTPVISDPGEIETPQRQIYLKTFGCQMNELDSELVRSQLAALGYGFTKVSSEADVILYNTCSVRQQAENKVLSRVGLVAIEKSNGRKVILGLIGCMAEREGSGLIRKYPHIDLLCGPGELDKLPILIDNAFKTDRVLAEDRIALNGNRTRRSSTLSAVGDNLEMLDLSRAFDPDRAAAGGTGGAGGKSAYVRITRGCNKFCTYCVVPYTRGAEVHRPPDHILDECQKLVDQGVIEITLLGQTVNHYMYVHGAAVTVNGVQAAQVGPGLGAFKAKTQAEGLANQRTTTFSDLLKRIHDEIPAIRRLRFVTSYPRDFSDDALQVMAESPRICRYLHVPAQSGSDRILKLMNRGYTVDQYLDFIDRARSILPDVSIAGDLIVGFPTETQADHEATMDLMRRVGFKNNFIFKYSPRPGTTAFDRLPDNVPEPIKRQRINELLDLQSEISASVHEEYVGRVVEVFVEKISRNGPETGVIPDSTRVLSGDIELRWEQKQTSNRHKSTILQMSGRTTGDLIAVFDPQDSAALVSPNHLIGTIQTIRVTGSGSLLLHGDLAHIDENLPIEVQEPKILSKKVAYTL